MVTDFKYLISEAIFSAFAKLGKWTFNDEYMFSEKGIDQNGNVVSKGSLVYEGIGDSDNEFTPSAAFDALTGQTSLSRDKVRFNPDGSGWLAGKNIMWDEYGNATYDGFVRNKKKSITTENVQRYLRQDIPAQQLDFDKCGSCIELNEGVETYLALPLLSNYFAPRYTDEQKDLIRSFVGVRLIVYNKTGGQFIITRRAYYANASGAQIHNDTTMLLMNKVYVFECVLTADPVRNEECIGWNEVSNATIV